MLTKTGFERQVKQISTKVVGDDREEQVLETKVSNRITRMDQRNRSTSMGTLLRCNSQDAGQHWARAINLVLDRPDVQYAVKERCREIASVDCGGWGAASSGAPEAPGASSSRTPAESWLTTPTPIGLAVGLS